MPILIRRSNLMVPVTNARFVQGAWRHGADAITLDLEDGVAPALKAGARELVREAVATAGKGAAEVFVRVNKEFLEADVEASVWPGLNGIMLPKVESPEDVVEASEVLGSAERRRGIEPGRLRLILLLESANAVWRVREIISAGDRVSQVGLDESDLSASLGISPSPEYDPYVYARGRLAIEATAAGVQPVGVAHPLGTLPRLLPDDEMLKIATDSKNLGFKGIICPHPSWISPVNTAFTPTEEQVDFYTQVRDVFAQAIAAGTAAVPFAGRMIDVPVDEWAKVVMATAAACKLRDDEKRTALDAVSG
ncbi:MAG: aldolase/citrate lyase family protein [Dehalococcoidia bacterium]